MVQRLIVIMGVSGSGKSTIGRALASGAGWPFLEGDDFHPPANTSKMAAGAALTDADRVAWLDAIAAEVVGRNDPRIVLACSALTAFVQQRLSRDMGRAAIYCWLDAPKAVIKRRMLARQHFMPTSLLQSQLDALSPPPEAFQFDAEAPPGEIVDQILACLASAT
ncbi:MAG: gluconokinase, GntK/IdnK-type [Pseudomonadota bacterium]